MGTFHWESVTLNTLIAALFLLATRAAFAWSDDGHELVAQIAFDRLTPAKQQKLSAIVATLSSGKAPYNAVTVACWPDDIKWQRPGTKPWHYIDIPVPSGPAPGAPNVVTKLTEMVAQYKAADAGPRTQANRRRKAEAIAFLIHFAGDIHQPLHAAEHASDGGGNAVTIANAAKGTNLHHFWDGAYGVRMASNSGNVVVPGNSPRPITALETAFRARVGAIVSQYPPGFNWNHLGQDYAAWAQETHDKAVSIAYAGLKPSGMTSNPATVTPAYVSEAKALAGKRIALAGYRLAALLDSLL